MALTIEYFNKRYQKDKSGCWLWIGERNKAGYPIMNWPESPGRKRYFAHRWAYERFKDPKVKWGKDWFCLHTCDVPSCVNPEHLWAGTKSDNMKDCYDKKRSWLQSKDGKGMIQKSCKRAAKAMWAKYKNHPELVKRSDQKGEKNPNVKLTEAQAKQVLRLYDKGFSRAYISKRLGVSISAANNIIRGVTWKYLSENSPRSPRQDQLPARVKGLK